MISWARRVTVAGIRRRADLANRISDEDTLEADRTRFLRYWWFDDGRRPGLEGALPADQDADRAIVVVHAELAALGGDAEGCEIEGGPVIHPETARRLSCDARLQLVLHDDEGEAVGIGRVSRTPPPWLLRQLRYRDRGCTFPGCESRRFLHAHHMEHWGRGGPTDLDNLVLVCTLHHKLVHEYGWRVELDLPGAPRWFRPTGGVSIRVMLNCGDPSAPRLARRSQQSRDAPRFLAIPNNWSPLVIGDAVVCYHLGPRRHDVE